MITGKKVVGSKVNSWNRGYRPGGGNLKIYNKGLKFEDGDEPMMEVWEEDVTRYQGNVQIETEPKEQAEVDEMTVEVITRPFEIEQVSRTVQVTREPKKPQTPPFEEVRVSKIKISYDRLFIFLLLDY